MATLAEIYDIRYNNLNLKKKTTSAVAKAANDILNESPATPNHAERIVWSKEALLNTPQSAEVIMWNVAQNTTINANPDTATDNDIQFVVNGAIDAIATA